VRLKQQENKAKIPFKQVSNEIKSLFPYINKIGFSYQMLITDYKTPDTIPVLLVQWKNGLSRNYKRKENQKLKTWMQTRLQLDTLKIVNY
jgi:hypothetical protein